MTARTAFLISLALTAAALLAGLLLWERLPDAMASHWNVRDEADGFMPKFWGVVLLPLVSAALLALLFLLPQTDPLKANLAQFRGTYHLFVVCVAVFMSGIHGLTLAWNLGFRFAMSSAVMPMLGLLFFVVGYLLRETKRNFFVGIRTPWTLSSDAVWEKTHRLGAVLFMASGALALLGGFFGGTTALALLLLPSLGSALFLTVYSYVLYRRETRA